MEHMLKNGYLDLLYRQPQIWDSGDGTERKIKDRISDIPPYDYRE